MPIIKSAIKRARQSVTRRERNLKIASAVKKDIKAVLSADAKSAQAALAEAYSEIDRAVKKGYFHKNTAARRKAKLAKAARTLGDTPKSAAKPAAKKATAKKPATKKKTTKK